MKNRIPVVLLSLVLILSSGGKISGQKGKSKNLNNNMKGKVELFNGKDLNNWFLKLRDPAADPLKVFTVQNGVMHFTGDFGYARTKEMYSDYSLHVEWRWPAVATNSGVFIHAQLPDTIWPRAIECQLKAGNAGDFNCNGGSDMNERRDKAIRVVKRVGDNQEKPVGEWNTMDVICKANTIELIINGVSQNKATGVFAGKGFIGLQSEGKEVEFRNIFITKLKK